MHTIPMEENGRKLDFFRTFMAWVEGSIGSKQYRHLFVEDVHDSVDVIGDGDLACAMYVSAMLHSFSLIKAGVHTTVDVTTSDMLVCGWKNTDKPQAGAVVVWGKKLSDTDGEMHLHIGICLDDEFAVSTSPRAKAPVKHRIDDLLDHKGRKRAVECYMIHPKLTLPNDVEYV